MAKVGRSRPADGRAAAANAVEPVSAVSSIASIPNAWPAFNLNREVAVRLTEDGIEIMRRNHDRLNNATGYFAGHRAGILGEFIPPKVDAEGWTRFQLWSLMHEFGADIRMGGPVPFETTIRLDAQGLVTHKIPLQFRLLSAAAQAGSKWGALDDGDASGIEAPSGVETGNTDSTVGESPTANGGDVQGTPQ